MHTNTCIHSLNMRTHTQTLTNPHFFLTTQTQSKSPISLAFLHCCVIFMAETMKKDSNSSRHLLPHGSALILPSLAIFSARDTHKHKELSLSSHSSRRRLFIPGGLRRVGEPCCHREYDLLDPHFPSHVDNATVSSSFHHTKRRAIPHHASSPSRSTIVTPGAVASPLLT